MEVHVMKKLRHPNLIRLLEASKRCIVMEYCSGGDLQARLRTSGGGGGGRLGEDKVWYWFVQLCLGLHHVHQQHILHRDIKTANVFLSNEGFLVLGDFGIARDLAGAGDAAMANTVIGTPLYMAPEMFEGKIYTLSSDVWALGCVLYELCAGAPPFSGASTPHLMNKICNGRYTPLSSSKFSPAMIHLIDSMLNLRPERRPTVDGILRDPSMRVHLQRYAMDRLQSNDSRGSSSKLKNGKERLVLVQQLEKLGIQVASSSTTVLPGEQATSDSDGRAGVTVGGTRHTNRPASGSPGAIELRLMAIREQERQDQLVFALKKLQEIRLQRDVSSDDNAPSPIEPAAASSASDNAANAGIATQQSTVFKANDSDIQWNAPVSVDRPARDNSSGSTSQRRDKQKDTSNVFLGVPRTGVPLTSRAKQFAAKSPVCQDVRVLRKQEAAKTARRYRRELDARFGSSGKCNERRRSEAASDRGSKVAKGDDDETDRAIVQAMGELQRFIDSRDAA